MTAPEPARADTARPGHEVLTWLQSPDATAQARRVVRRHRLPGGAATVDDLLGDATVAVLAWQRGPSAHDPDNPAAYGTRVLRSAARRMLQGRLRIPESPLTADDLLGALPPPEVPSADPADGDELRLEVEQLGGQPWLVAAALSVITFVLFPDAVPAGLPAPRAGARPDQARVWPALHLAGERSLFPGPGGDPPARRRARARRIAAVLARLELAAGRLVRSGGAERD